MNRCIQLAMLGKGHVAPNPMVGAVIVHNDKIIGEGYHERYGGPHAEVNAINSVKDQSLLPESTIYVSLEPCSHFGKTPPCANLIVSKKLKRVIIGSKDPHDKVAGTGIQLIKNAGIEVTVGVCKEECETLNKHFFTFHQKKRPYVTLKWAQTKNGFIDKGQSNAQVDWITKPEVQPLVHKWRSEHQAILVGRKTVENDDPSLTVRFAEGNNPIRIVLDSELNLSGEQKVFDNKASTLVVNRINSSSDGNIERIKIDELSVPNILDALYKKGIQSVFVEGGQGVLQSFIDSKMWDEAKVLIGETEFSEGTRAPMLNAQLNKSEMLNGDTLNLYLNK